MKSCRHSDTGGSRQRLYEMRQRISTALSFLVLIGIGLGTTKSQAQNRAYVPNSGSNTVSVIDTATDTVATTIPPLGCSPQGVAITPDGARAYLTFSCTDAVLVIDTTTNSEFASIPVGANPDWITITPDGTRAYVSNFNGGVSVIDIATNTVIATIPVGLSPEGIAITPDGTRAYVDVSESSTVSVIDLATNTVTSNIPVGGAPFGIALTPDGTRAYVANLDDVAVIDTASNMIVDTISVVAPVAVAITPDGSRAYVTEACHFSSICPVGNGVVVIDTATNIVVATIPAGVDDTHFGIAITPDGLRAYVTDAYSSAVSVIDTTANSAISTIPVGLYPWAVAITPNPLTPTDKEQCKRGGYLKFGPPAGPFKNQGQCVSYVEHHQGS